MKNVIVIGAGGHGRVAADALLAMQRAGEPVAAAGFVDADPALRDARVLGLPVLGTDEELASIAHDAVILAVGDNVVRRALFERLASRGERFVTVCHPAAVVSPHAHVGEGTLIAARAVVNADAVVGRNVILNTGCVIEHDDVVGDHAHIAPGAVLGGNVLVGEGALVGIGATVMPGRSVGAWATVGAGACVTKPVPDEAVAFGVPARNR